jgi:hypothetical protein
VAFQRQRDRSDDVLVVVNERDVGHAGRSVLRLTSKR